MAHLNYHHLRYFWVVARERNLTRAARSLNVSASALSTQLRALEAELGRPLFDRDRKTFALTEAGRLAFEYAETIFRAGAELLDTFAGRSAARRKPLRAGATAALPRGFLLEFIRPALASHEVGIVLRSGSMCELLELLDACEADVILSTEPAPADAGRKWNTHMIAGYPVSLVAARRFKVGREPFPRNLRHVPLVLPGRQSAMREPFDTMLAGAGVRPHVAAEVDDMATLCLLACEGVGVALAPTVAVKGELRERRLREICRVPGLSKPVYAVTLQRQFPHPLVRELLAHAQTARDVEQRRPQRR